MDAQQSQRIQDLQQSFDIFNRVSQRLEASYQTLESQVVLLKDVLVSKQPAASSNLTSIPANSSPASSPASQEPIPYQAILMALPAGVVVLDGKGHVRDCNPAAVTLLGEPLKGELWTRVIGRVFAPRHDDGHEISLRNGRRVSIATCPIGEVPGQVLLLTDVTATRQLQDQVSQHQRLIAMGEMAANLAHQIRTPLSSSLLFGAQLKNPSLDTQARNDILGKVFGNLRHLEHLINDMLLFSRQGYGGDEIISITDFYTRLIAAAGPLCEQHAIELHGHCDVAQGSIKGNANILHSALLNLVNNAIQAMQGSGKLQIAFRQAALDYMEICVIDNGPGVASDIRDKLFTPFFTTRRDGTGLGLAIVNAVARAHGGSVRLESSEGMGSEFIIRIPALKDRDDKPRQAARATVTRLRTSAADSAK